jgi:hypothetical protein
VVLTGRVHSSLSDLEGASLYGPHAVGAKVILRVTYATDLIEASQRPRRTHAGLDVIDRDPVLDLPRTVAPIGFAVRCGWSH